VFTPLDTKFFVRNSEIIFIRFAQRAILISVSRPSPLGGKYEATAMRISMIKAARVGKFFMRVLMAAFLFLLSASGGETAELRKFTLGYSTVGPAGTGLWMAKEIGAFEKYDIDAELIFVSSGPIIVQALLGGDMNAGLATTNAVTAVLAGAPLVS
jgi:ABC-type nitrate/sulfonate/bicarbonate transport system substrate-binding protein